MNNSLIAAVKAVLPHAAKSKDRTPSLEAVMILPNKVVATDRYTIAESAYEVEANELDGEFLLSSRDARLLVQAEGVRSLSAEEGVLRVEHDKGAMEFHEISGKFPPVNQLVRLLDKPVVERLTARLSPVHLAKLNARHLVRDPSERNLPIEFYNTGANLVKFSFAGHTRGVLATVGPFTEEAQWPGEVR